MDQPVGEGVRVTNPAGSALRVLVTGGAGFIGSHLVDRLLHEGHAVVALDNLSSSTGENLGHLEGNPRFALRRHDVCDPFDADVDRIYNFACPASPVQYQRDPVRTMKTSVFGALNALELARRLGCPVLQGSTSEVYGDPEAHPQDESYWGRVNPVGPRACYDEGKRAAETLFFDYRRQHGAAIKVARIFNTYGPRMQADDGRVVSNFIVAALRNAPLTVYGDGAQTRSLCYVDDLVDGLSRFMETPDEVTGPLNLGAEHEVTVMGLAEMVRDLTGSSSAIERRPLPQDDPRQRRPALNLAAKTLGWRPTTPLREGLLRTIGWFEQTLRTRAHA